LSCLAKSRDRIVKEIRIGRKFPRLKKTFLINQIRGPKPILIGVKFSEVLSRLETAISEWEWRFLFNIDYDFNE
jgi:hypothetical protein